MHWSFAAAIQLFVIFKMTDGCMSSVNPDPDPTTAASAAASTEAASTAAACTCTIPANSVAPTCGAASALPAPTITINGDTDTCTVSWSGCMNYRYLINGMCIQEPIFADVTDVQGGYTCMNGFPTDPATGKVYQAIDCF